MSEQINEQLSAWVDDELDKSEETLLVRRLENDAALVARWQRYHLIGDAIRGQLPEQFDTGLAARVAARLADESFPAQRSVSRRAHWSRPFLGAAVAASVAVVSVLTVRQFEQPAADTIQVAEKPAAAESYRRIDPATLAASQPQVMDHLNQYLVNHNEFAARNGRLGMSPQVRIVGYDQPLAAQR